MTSAINHNEWVSGMTLNDSMNQHIELVLQMEQHPQFDNNSFASTQQVSYNTLYCLHVA